MLIPDHSGTDALVDTHKPGSHGVPSKGYDGMLRRHSCILIYVTRIRCPTDTLLCYKGQGIRALRALARVHMSYVTVK